MKIAIITPQSDAYSETFIRGHRDRLQGDVFFYHGGPPPCMLDHQKLAPERYRLRHFIFLIRSILSTPALQPDLYFLERSLEKVQPDVILAEYGPTAVAILPVIKKTGIPLVVHFHGYDASKTEIVREHLNHYREIFGLAKSIIAVSNHMKEAIRKMGCPENKIVLTRYGPDPVFYSNTPYYLYPWLFALGRFVDKKAPHLTILAFAEALKEIPEAMLRMAGEGPLRTVCEDLVSWLGISDRVIFTGVLTPEEVRTEMMNARAFVQHSKTASDGDMEGTPVSVLEAQAAALPVISTFHAGIPEVVLNETTGLLVAENDIKGMALHMVRLLRDPALAASMGRAGRSRVSEHFTLEKHIHTLQSVLQDAAR